MSLSDISSTSRPHHLSIPLSTILPKSMCSAPARQQVQNPLGEGHKRSRSSREHLCSQPPRRNINAHIYVYVMGTFCPHRRQVPTMWLWKEIFVPTMWAIHTHPTHIQKTKVNWAEQFVSDYCSCHCSSDAKHWVTLSTYILAAQLEWSLLIKNVKRAEDSQFGTDAVWHTVHQEELSFNNLNTL